MKLQDWVGREEIAEDEISPRLVNGFNATFDLAEATGGIAPLGIHWCLAPPSAMQSNLGPDGHPARGGFLPPVALPRRMWAGSRLTFHDELRIGDKITRHSRIAEVTEKPGRSGRLCFVAVDHKILSSRGIAIEERHDIVYRETTAGPALTPPPAGHSVPAPKWRQEARADPVMLFRYSALTFNGHRIHYDRDYATKVEHYPGLVVHGPLQATLLLNFAAKCAQAPPKQFSFRGLSPLIDLDPFSLNGRLVDKGLELWVESAAGRKTMQALASI